MVQIAVQILQYINISFSVIFIFIFSVRLCHLRHFALSQRYAKKYPKIRIILAIIYICLSIGFLTYSLVAQTFQNQILLYIFAGGGQCIDSIILLLQLWVLRRQLIKERPYTGTHLVFSIYLTLITIIRFVFVLVNLTEKQSNRYVDLGFYLAFMIDAILLLGYWIAKRQELPQFQQNKYFDFEEFQHDSSKFMMNRQIQISYLKKISDSFNYIRPTVTIEKGKFRIALQIFVEKQAQFNVLEEETEHKSQKQKQIKKQLKIVSSQLYTFAQLKELYKLCGRFDIKQRLNFEQIKMYEMYQNLQNYLQEIFNQKYYYIDQVLDFFNLPQQLMHNYSFRLRESFKGSEFDMRAKYDKNATLISVRMYKQLWIQDHYLFYMDILVLEGDDEIRPMKRYTDFEILHQNLLLINKKIYDSHYQLPELPKKHLFSLDETKVNQRRFQLQRYLRQLTNDQQIMLKVPQIRQKIFNFFNFKYPIDLKPILLFQENFFKGVQVFKGSISRALVNNDSVTFYEFKIFQKGMLLRVLKKRFSDFVYLHEQLLRWMNNTQINYKNIVLPEKHLYKSENHRHQKLKIYLINLVLIKEISKVYAVNCFFNIGSDTNMQDLSFSGIQFSPRQAQKMQKTQAKNEIGSEFASSPKYISPNDSSFSSKERMSNLIQQLGKF